MCSRTSVLDIRQTLQHHNNIYLLYFYKLVVSRKVYTALGDFGFTSDFSGKSILKNSNIIVVNGKIDSLQSVIDMSLLIDSGKHKEILQNVQLKLWQTAGEIANCSKDCLNAPITEDDLKNLELYIDTLGEPPNKFVRFNTQQSIGFNECRIKCRELETLLVKLLRDKNLRPEIFKYINRLSSLFFMLGYTSSNFQ